MMPNMKDVRIGMHLAMLGAKRMRNGKLVLPSGKDELKHLLIEKAEMLYNRRDTTINNGIVLVLEPTDDDLLADILMLTYEIAKNTVVPPEDD